MIDFRLLGTVEFFHGEDEIDLGPARQRCLLAILVLSRRPVIVEHLVERLWDDRPPQRARETLYVHIARLRSVLRQGGVSLLNTTAGYVCDNTRESVDVFRFEDLVAAAMREPDPVLRAATLGLARDQWRAEALSGLTGDWACRMRTRLHQQWISAVVVQKDAQLESGDHAAITAELADLVAKHPLEEPFTRQLMLAMYRSGRRGEALAVYRRTRQRLVDELGLEPGAELRELEMSILHDEVRI